MVLKYEKKNQIVYLTLNRPEARNAIDPELVLNLVAAWEEYKNDRSLRCAIVTGEGDKAFCAGADLGKLIPIVTGAKDAETDAERQIQNDPGLIDRALLRDFEIYKPIISAINGYAIGGGLELLYSTDIRIACEEARFGLQEVKWSVFPSGGSSVHLPRQISYAKAMEILITGELISAEEALNFGLVNRVVHREHLMEESERYASIIVKNGPLATSAIKRAVLNNIGLPIREALQKETEIAASVFASKDAREGPKAFKEKREPKYIGE
jgi:enoyl-CoA hydratase